MFSFTSTAAQNDLRSTIRQFALNEIAPVALDNDRRGTVPLEVYRRFWEAGIARRFLPPEDDPRCPYLVDACIAAEELAYACPATASLLMLPVFFNRLILLHLRDPHRSQFRQRLFHEPVMTAFAATERRAGSDVLSVETHARRTDDEYVIDGRKEYSSNARHADFLIVVARTGADGVRASDALSWFLVPGDAGGLTIGARWRTLGLRAMDLSPVEFEGVRVPAESVLGEEGRGMALMVDSLDQSRTGIAAIGVGIARRARDEVAAFASRRHLYGSKLYKLQDYRFRIAAMEKDVAAARALTWLSAAKHDQGLEHTKEASIAKLYSGEMVVRVTQAATAMLGATAYTGQSIVEKLFRDAPHVAIVEGSPEVHKEIIFASILRHGTY